MRASINQTGRKKIPVEEVSIELVDGEFLLFKWNLSDVNLGADFEAVLELSAIGNNLRQVVAVNEIPVSGESKISIKDFLIPQSIIGRFKVVNLEKDGIRFITSESQTLRLKNNKLEGEQGKSLLDVHWDQQLNVPWQLIFEDSEPILKVSDQFENAPKIYSHIVFQTSILPEVFKQITFWLLTEDPDETQNIKISYWWKLVEDYGLTSEDRSYFTSLVEKDFEMIKEIDLKSSEIADKFAVRHRIVQKLSNFLTEEEA
jgi:hypothetical protein